MAKIAPFDQFAERYEQWFERNREVYLSEISAVKSLMPKSGRGLEIGVGTGRFAVPLGIKLGIEPAEKMGKIARKRGIRVISGVAENLPIEDERYDFVLMVTTICFVDNAQKALREITYFYPGKEGAEVNRMETICKIESTKCVSEIMSPFSGVVLRFNNALFDTPDIINKDPYGKGWIAIVHPTNIDKEKEKLLKPEFYAEHIKALTEIDETLLIHRWRKKPKKDPNRNQSNEEC